MRINKLLGFVALSCLLVAGTVSAEVKRAKFTANNQYLIVEALDDDLIHLELSSVGSGPDETTPIYTSPMICKTDYSGPSLFFHSGNVIETADTKIMVNLQNLCISILEKIKNRPLTTVCPADLRMGQ